MKYEDILRSWPPSKYIEEHNGDRPDYTRDEKYVGKLPDMFKNADRLMNESRHFYAQVMHCCRYKRVCRERLLGLLVELKEFIALIEKDLQ